MRATGIRIDNRRYSNTPEEDFSVPEIHHLQRVCDAIIHATSRAGFITDAEPIGKYSIKIGMHSRCFRVNTTMIGHNARVGRYISSPKGYKRTDVPTWDQRVEFNDIVNNCFDRAGLAGRIMSGTFKVRTKDQGRCDEDDWKMQGAQTYSCDTGNYGASVNGFGEVISEIMTEKEAREHCESDRLEAEHKAKTRVERLAKAKLYRDSVKAFEKSERVTIAGAWEYWGPIRAGNTRIKNGVKIRHWQFSKMLARLPEDRARKIKSASIAQTAQELLVF